MAHTTAKAVFAAKRAHLNLPLPGDDYAPPDDEQMTTLDGEPIDLHEAWPMPGEQEEAK